MPSPPLSLPAPSALRDAGLDVERAGRLTAQLSAWAEARRINGMLLRVQCSGHVLDWAVGTRSGTEGSPFDAETLVRLYSMSKPMTSALMFTLFEEGCWRFDDPITRFLPELSDLRVAATGRPPARDIVMRDLLLHQAGLVYGVGDADEVDRLYRSAPVLDFEASLDTMLDRLAQLPLAAEPGTPRYSIAHDLLGLIAQRITDRPLAVSMRERLFAPLGMVDTGFSVEPAQRQRLATLHQADGKGGCVPADLAAPGPMHWKLHPPPALCSGGAGLVATIDDVSRFMRLFERPRGTGRPAVLSPATLRLMTSATTVTSSQRPGAFMTPGWWTRLERPADCGSCASPGSLFTSGSGGNFAWVDPARELVVIGLLNVIGWQPADLPARVFDPLVYQALVQD